MLNILNQTPAELKRTYADNIAADFDPAGSIKDVMAAPLYNPLVKSQPVEIELDKNPLSADDITALIGANCGTNVDLDAKNLLNEIYAQSLIYFDRNTPLTVEDTFVTESAVRAQLPFPSASILYTPSTDIIPTCKEYLAGKADSNKVFASFALYTRVHALGVAFTTENDFNDFKAWLVNQTNPIMSQLTAETQSLLSNFDNLTLDQLTESILIRKDDSDNNDPFSFARILMSKLLIYTNNNQNASFMMPFSVSEFFIPKSVIFINLEKHARSTANKIKNEWDIINQSLNNKPKVVSTKALTKLTATTRALKKIQTNAQFAAQNNQGLGVFKSAKAQFRNAPLKPVDLTKLIKRVMDKMANVSKSENSYKSVKMSFAKPNRRDPDDFNKQGKVVSQKYKPDIHVYIDTSGSISEANYQEAIKALIVMAKKLNVNLYFNSFSHVMSQCTKLELKNKSYSQVYRAFRKVPKVTGGTDYEQIWHYINQSKKRKRELSIIMTDFEWSPPNRYVNHPKNLYYIPCSNMDWSTIVRSAQHFSDSMTHIDPDIRRKLLF